jgi:hypothetical protein
MILIFAIGLAFTYFITMAMRRILPTPITNSFMFMAVHTISLLITATVMVYGLSGQYQVEPTLFFLLSSFFPQAIWFGTDLSKLGFDYVMAPIRKSKIDRNM